MTFTLSGERVQAFVAPHLPPRPHALDLTFLQAILAEANQAVGRLDGMTSALPDLKLFLYSYVRKEAVLSSQIEGTQSLLSDLLLYENKETPGVPLDDVHPRPFRSAADKKQVQEWKRGLMVPPEANRSPASR